MRKHYIDNLRWIVILLLIPYHAAMAWNSWGENNYIVLGSDKALSSFIVFCSPFFMPLLFLLAGMSTRFALVKRTGGQYIVERVKRLIVPLVFGTLVIMPVMTYLADKHNLGYEGSFISHYSIFFTKFTDLTGGDGGFSFGQFWFLLYLFVISLIALGVIMLQRKVIMKEIRDIPLWLVIILGLPLFFMKDILSVGGKSLLEFLYIFLIGYYVFSRDEVILKLSRFKWIFLAIGLVSEGINIWLFIWSDMKLDLLNNVANCLAEWFMILALIGIAKDHLDSSGRLAGFFTKISFAIFSLHYVFVVIFQYLADIYSDNLFVLYVIPVVIAYLLTIIFSWIFVRVPILSFLIGTGKR
ncbi:MAG: acyltransferase [Clostridiales bacterium]|nr:acyltransferase [Clostridiales bacterium]